MFNVEQFESEKFAEKFAEKWHAEHPNEDISARDRPTEGDYVRIIDAPLPYFEEDEYDERINTVGMTGKIICDGRDYRGDGLYDIRIGGKDGFEGCYSELSVEKIEDSGTQEEIERIFEREDREIQAKKEEQQRLREDAMIQWWNANMTPDVMERQKREVYRCNENQEELPTKERPATYKMEDGVMVMTEEHPDFYNRAF